MNYEKYENELVERLAIKGADTKVLPHVATLNEPRQTAKPQLFVIINGANFESPDNLGNSAQLETVQGEIFIRAKHRRGKLGIFHLYELLTDLLMGYRLEGAKTSIVFNQFGYVAGIQNNWQYALTFSFTAYRMPKEVTEEYVLIKEINTPIKSK
ncbi:Gp37 family protein [Paludibacteraceae bacterium OttesenSCG-928-F17]|nr:Gp37 family protein [Paludibacteraceae bacterium OttesenSCG-928-F17]